MSVKDVFKSRLRIRALEEEVEKPMNVHRWRTLEVRRPGDHELRDSVFTLYSRLYNRLGELCK